MFKQPYLLARTYVSLSMVVFLYGRLYDDFFSLDPMLINFSYVHNSEGMLDKLLAHFLGLFLKVEKYIYLLMQACTTIQPG